MPLHFVEKKYHLALITEEHKHLNEKKIEVYEKALEEEKGIVRPTTPASQKLPEISKDFVSYYNEHCKEKKVHRTGELLLKQLEMSSGLVKGSTKKPNTMGICLQLLKLKDCTGTLGEKALDLIRCILELSPTFEGDLKDVYELGITLCDEIVSQSEHKYVITTTGKILDCAWLLMWKVIAYDEVKPVEYLNPNLDSLKLSLMKALRSIYNIFDLFQDHPDELMKLRFLVECLRRLKQGTESASAACVRALRLIPNFFNGNDDQRKDALRRGGVTIRDEYDQDSPGHTSSIFIWLENLEVLKILSCASAEDLNILMEFQYVMTRKSRTCTWELIYLYTFSLTHIALTTASSKIKKVAIEGHDYHDEHCYGIIELLNFKGGADIDQDWKIRFGALKAITTLWKCSDGGEKTIAWASLQ